VRSSEIVSAADRHAKRLAACARDLRLGGIPINEELVNARQSGI
jgi:hypothetical protein